MQSKINSIMTTVLFGLSVLWYNYASATDKTETLIGTITLGSTGYGIKLENGKIIGFMGRGGNKVFAACHNGDRCEITGVVVYHIKNPIFLTVTSVHKLNGPAKTMAGNTPAQTQPPTDKDAPVTVPAPSATNTTQQTLPSASAKKAVPLEASATDTDKSDTSSPLLPGNDTGR